MNYEKHYALLIERARVRVLDGYRERHHVVPRCLGGGDEPENIVELTPEEHFFAHQLLMKLHPGVRGIAHAATRMAKSVTGRRAFGWLRRRHAAAMIGHQYNVGRKHTDAAKARIAAAHSGMKRGAKARQNMSAAGRGKKLSAETRAKIALALLGNQHARGHKHSPEWRAELAQMMRGRKMPDRGPDWRSNISKAMRGKKQRPRTAEHSAKISAALRARNALLKTQTVEVL